MRLFRMLQLRFPARLGDNGFPSVQDSQRRWLLRGPAVPLLSISLGVSSAKLNWPRLLNESNQSSAACSTTQAYLSANPDSRQWLLADLYFITCTTGYGGTKSVIVRSAITMDSNYFESGSKVELLPRAFFAPQCRIEVTSPALT